MAEGFTASTGAIKQTGTELSGLAEQAKRIQTTASNAEVAEDAWGKIGTQFAKVAYDGLLEKFSQHLEEIREGIADAGSKLTETADDYDEMDQEQQDAIQQILSQLGTGGKA